MTDERWHQLMADENATLSAKEIAEGWHWCPDWDFLLVGPDCPEAEFCYCKGET